MEDHPVRTVVGGFIAIVVFVVMLFVVFGSWGTIDQGERGVLLRNGAVVSTKEPGLYFKTPWIDTVVGISVQQHTIRWACVLSSDGSFRSNCDANHDQPVMQAYSQDQQPADLRVSVNYHVPPAEVTDVYTNFGSLENLADRVIARKAPQAVKTVFGAYNAVSVIQTRAAFNAAVFDAVAKAIDGPVIIDSVQVENIDFSSAYEASVEARMTAQVEVQRREQELAQKKIEAQITVTNAQALADSNLAVAKAQAEATRINGEATADAIKARAAALSGNPLLIQLTAAEKWDGRLPQTMLPGSAVPFVSVATQQ